MSNCETCRDKDWCSSEEIDQEICPVRSEDKWKALSYYECYCTKCHFYFDIMKCDFIERMNFCPNCGADKRGGRNEVIN